MTRFLTLMLSLCAVRAAADEAALRIAPDGADPTRVTVSCPLPSGSSASADDPALRQRLTFALVDDAGRVGDSVFGTYAVVEGRLTFRPRFGLVRGATYRAVSGDAEIDYRVPEVDGDERATVRSITPTGDPLPANVLRFYITFSRPMREGRDVLGSIRLLDGQGNVIHGPWRDIELWNADATRLSLFLHPGRIKQGVNLREQLGPLLRPGERYVLVIPADLRDARGVPLGREVRHAFTTNDELRLRIDVSKWRLTVPAVGTSEPLTIEVDRPLDAALARRCLQIRDAAGRDVDGVIEPANAERRWTFTPVTTWTKEPYVLHVDPVLEDVCGNNPLREFDFDLESAKVEVLPPVLRREFTPR